MLGDVRVQPSKPAVSGNQGAELATDRSLISPFDALSIERECRGSLRA
jgi:hypothetical protein